MTDNDPQAKYRHLPPAGPAPEDWTTEQPTEPVPGSVRAADDDAQLRAARYEIERAAGGL